MGETVTVAVAVSFTIIAVVGGIAAGLTIYNVNQDRLYFEHANKCVDAGGSWVPGRVGSGYGVCIAKH